MNEIWRITTFVDERRLAFAVARIIMLSGVQVREYTRDSPENAEDTQRVLEAAEAVLAPEELVALRDFKP